MLVEPSHAEWQAQVVDLAKMLGWKFLHVRKSIGKGKKWATTTNVVGWPDLFLWHPRQVRFAAVELKVGKDKPTDEQLEVLGQLGASGASTMVAYPRDLDRLSEMLRRASTTPVDHAGTFRP